MDSKLLCIFFILTAIPNALSDFQFNAQLSQTPTKQNTDIALQQPIVQPYFGSCNQEGHSYWGKPREHGFYHHHHYRYGFLLFHFFSHYFQTGLSNTKIIETIKDLGQEESTEVLIQFMTAMSESEAEKGVSYFGVKQDQVKQLLNQLKSGNEAEIAKAKDTIHNALNNIQCDSLNYQDWFYVRYLASIYYVHLKREQAKEVVITDPLEKLIVGLTVLASVEDRHNIQGIDFKPLVKILIDKGEAGRAEVVKIISDWIDKADIRTLQAVGFIYSTSTQNVEVPTTTSTTTTTTTTTPAPIITTKPPVTGLP